MRKLFNLLGLGALTLFVAYTASAASNVYLHQYASQNVTTSAYVTITNSTANPSSQVLDCDTSGQVIKLAKGASGAELDLFAGPVNGCIIVPVGYLMPIGTRLSLEAVVTSGSTGYSVITTLP